MIPTKENFHPRTLNSVEFLYFIHFNKIDLSFNKIERIGKQMKNDYFSV